MVESLAKLSLAEKREIYHSILVKWKIFPDKKKYKKDVTVSAISEPEYEPEKHEMTCKGKCSDPTLCL